MQAFTRIMKPLLLCVTQSRFFPLFPHVIADWTRVSIGAGSVLNTRACALVVYSSGCGSHYSLRLCYISHYIFGQKVDYLLMKRAGSGFIFWTPMRGLTIRRLTTHSGELHWECFCEPSSPRVVKGSLIVKSSVTPSHIPSSSFLSPYHDGCSSLSPTYRLRLHFLVSQCSTSPGSSMCSFS